MKTSVVGGWIRRLLCLLVAMTVGSVVRPASPAIAAESFPAYRLEVALDPEANTIAGTMTLDWANVTGQRQDALYLRLFPNAAYYGPAELVIEWATLDGQSVNVTIGDDPTVARIDADQSIGVGEGTVLMLGFLTRIPERTDGEAASFGVFGGSAAEGWSLADWYPILAGWEPGSGWYLDPPTAYGDPTFADAATYAVDLTVPDDLVVVASGRTTGITEETGTQRLELESAPARDFTITLLPDDQGDNVSVVERTVNDTMIRLTLPGRIDIDGLGAALLEDIGAAFPVYEDWLGPYADEELDITTTPLSNASGVSWNGLVWLGLEPVAADGRLDRDEREFLRFLVFHEVAHQWIAGIVGSNNNDHGFMTEGLANHLAVLVLRDTAGTEAAERLLRGTIAGGYLDILGEGHDGVANAPVTNETDIAVRSRLVYGKAAIGFEAIRQLIGDDMYRDGIAAYAHTYRFLVSTPDDLRAALRPAGDSGLDEAWEHWFLTDDATPSEVIAVLDGFAKT